MPGEDFMVFHYGLCGIFVHVLATFVQGYIWCRWLCLQAAGASLGARVSRLLTLCMTKGTETSGTAR